MVFDGRSIIWETKQHHFYLFLGSSISIGVKVKMKTGCRRVEIGIYLVQIGVQGVFCATHLQKFRSYEKRNCSLPQISHVFKLFWSILRTRKIGNGEDWESHAPKSDLANSAKDTEGISFAPIDDRGYDKTPTFYVRFSWKLAKLSLIRMNATRCEKNQFARFPRNYR